MVAGMERKSLWIHLLIGPIIMYCICLNFAYFAYWIYLTFLMCLNCFKLSVYRDFSLMLIIYSGKWFYLPRTNMPVMFSGCLYDYEVMLYHVFECIAIRISTLLGSKCVPPPSQKGGPKFWKFQKAGNLKKIWDGGNQKREKDFQNGKEEKPNFLSWI